MCMTFSSLTGDTIAEWNFTHLLMMMVSVRMPYLGLESERAREKVRLRLFRALHW